MGESLSFHRFPKDPGLREEWVRRCYRKDKFSPENKRICSKHFTLNDFQDYMQAHVLGRSPKTLKSTAIPSMHLHPPTSPTKVTKNSDKRRKRAQNRELKSFVKEIMDSTSVEASTSALGAATSNIASASSSVITTKESTLTIEDDLQQNIATLQNEVDKLKSRICEQENKEQSLRDKVLQLEEVVKDANKSFEETTKEAF
ncbi:52 kDa repressor of the inhibitor of the protein kinase-like [Tribolium madens]|uniref:52 kDa repressor of the inhibitor of the protein kinase-like n=1 Tax=Tribolium madens TaxID=41895 RepID=UPI001CF72187|nr:52 kDa repressor of the inhibitor of the protein kinase-like [Tribolium madens]